MASLDHVTYFILVGVVALMSGKAARAGADQRISHPPDLLVLEDGTAEFKWNYSFQDPVRIIWEHDRIPIKEIIRNQTGFINPLIVTNGQFDGRVEFESVERMITFFVNNVTSEDSMNYKLKVAHTVGTTNPIVRDEVKLTVIPSNHITFTVATGANSWPLSLPNNGTNMTLPTRNLDPPNVNLRVELNRTSPPAKSIVVYKQFDNGPLEIYKNCSDTHVCQSNIQNVSRIIIYVQFNIQNLHTIRVEQAFKINTGTSYDLLNQSRTQLETGYILAITFVSLILVALAIGLKIYFARRHKRTSQRNHEEDIPLLADVTAVAMTHHAVKSYLPVHEYMFKFDEMPKSFGNRKDTNLCEIVACVTALLNTSGGVVQLQGTVNDFEKWKVDFKRFARDVITPKSYDENIIFISGPGTGTTYIIVTHSDQAVSHIPTRQGTGRYFYVKDNGDVYEVSKPLSEPLEKTVPEDSWNRTTNIQMGVTDNVSRWSWTKTNSWKEHTNQLDSDALPSIPDNFRNFKVFGEDCCTPGGLEVRAATGGFHIAFSSIVKALSHEADIQVPSELTIDVLSVSVERGVLCIKVTSQSSDESVNTTSQVNIYNLHARRLLKKYLVRAHRKIGRIHIKSGNDVGMDNDLGRELRRELDEFARPNVGTIGILKEALAKLLMVSDTYLQDLLAEDIMLNTTRRTQEEVLNDLKNNRKTHNIIEGFPYSGKTTVCEKYCEHLVDKQKKKETRICFLKFQDAGAKTEEERKKGFSVRYCTDWSSLGEMLKDDYDCLILDISDTPKKSREEWEQIFEGVKAKRFILCIDKITKDDDQDKSLIDMKKAFSTHCHTKRVNDHACHTMHKLDRTSMKIASYIISTCDERNRELLQEELGDIKATVGDDIMLHVLNPTNDDGEGKKRTLANYVRALIHELILPNKSIAEKLSRPFVYEVDDVLVIVDTTNSRNNLAQHVMTDLIKGLVQAGNSLDKVEVISLETCRYKESKSVIYVLYHEDGDDLEFMNERKLMTRIASMAVRRLDIVYLGTAGDQLAKDMGFDISSKV